MTQAITTSCNPATNQIGADQLIGSNSHEFDSLGNLFPAFYKENLKWPTLL